MIVEKKELTQNGQMAAEKKKYNTFFLSKESYHGTAHMCIHARKITALKQPTKTGR